MDFKIKTATFHAPTADILSSVEIIFENGRDAWLDNDIKPSLLAQGIVPLGTGFEDMPPVYYKDKSNKIELGSCTRDAGVLAIAKKYREYLAGDLELKDGDSLL